MRPGRFLLLLVLAAGAPIRLAAQVPAEEAPTEPPPQPFRYDAPRLAISVTGGTLGFNELQTQGVRAERLGRDGTPLEETLFRRTLGAGGGWQAAVSAVLGLSPAWAVRAGASWGRAGLEPEYEDVDESFEDELRAIPSAQSSELTVLAAEAALRFRMRSGRRLQPYAELGLAAVRLELEESGLVGAASLEDGHTSLAGLVAVGAVAPFWGPLAAKVQVSGQLFRTPLDAAPAGTPVPGSAKLRLTIAEPETSGFADPAREFARTVRLDLGLVIELGSASGR